MPINWRVLLAFPMAAAIALGAAGNPPAVPRYDHIFLIIEENHGYHQIAGNTAAPNLNRLAQTYGLATQYFSVTDPSAPNYVAMLGGNFFGIADDNAYYTHTVNQPSLMSQLDAANLTWKGYFQGMPYAGYKGICYPGRCNGVPDFDSLYSAKHNGIPYFQSIQSSPFELNKMTPIDQLAVDLANNDVPNFGYIVPDQCHDMHGSPPWCVDSGKIFSPQDQYLVGAADQFAAKQVDQIMHAAFWSQGNNAIVITFDEGNGTLGCCDANPGTGLVFTVVITSNGPRALQDPTPYNHYSLLQTFQQAFGLGCLQFTCDTANVTPMAALFAVSSPARAEQ
jgi:hypothetical protein